MPEKVGVLFCHVADNLMVHAASVGVATESARRAHDVLLAIAREYRALGVSAERAASVMRSAEHLPVIAHDPSLLDRAALLTWLEIKIRLQRGLAELLCRHADESQQVASRMAAEPGAE